MRKAYVVEDDGTTRRLIVFQLTSLGWDVREFASGRDCFAAALSSKPDCIITDLRMPGMSGAELVEALGAARVRVPVIVLSAMDSNADIARRALAAGARFVLTKPCRPAEIRHALEMLSSAAA
jgi:CheY-like chemotaxis protein